MEISTFMMVHGRFLCNVPRSWIDGTDEVAVRMLCDAYTLFSVPRRRVQSPHGDHPFRRQLCRRLVPRRPESSVSCTAHGPAGLDRGSGRVQQRLRSQSRQSRYVRPHRLPSNCSFVCPPTNIDHQSDV